MVSIHNSYGAFALPLTLSPQLLDDSPECTLYALVLCLVRASNRLSLPVSLHLVSPPLRLPVRMAIYGARSKPYHYQSRALADCRLI